MKENGSRKYYLAICTWQFGRLLSATFDVASVSCIELWQRIVYYRPGWTAHLSFVWLKRIRGRFLYGAHLSFGLFQARSRLMSINWFPMPNCLAPAHHLRSPDLWALRWPGKTQIWDVLYRILRFPGHVFTFFFYFLVQQTAAKLTNFGSTIFVSGRGNEKPQSQQNKPAAAPQNVLYLYLHKVSVSMYLLCAFRRVAAGRFMFNK